MTPAEVREHCELDGEGRELLERAHRQLGLSARGWDRCLRLARTIADLAGEPRIAPVHVREAIEKRRRPDP
jgi:magnesium chelatase family protein